MKPTVATIQEIKPTPLAMRFFRRVDKQGSPTLIQAVGGLAAAILLIALVWCWNAILTALSFVVGLLPGLRETATLEIWVVPVLIILPLALWRLLWYVRLYRYRSDKFGGVVWRWWYSFPMGQVVRIRGRCQKCHEAFNERAFLMFGCSNYRCANCDTITDHTPRNWPGEIKQKVNKKFGRCPA